MHKAAALDGKEMISAGQGNEKRCAVKRQCFWGVSAVLTVSDIAAVYDAAVAAGRRRFRDGVGVKLEGPAKAVAGDTVTVTATLTGKADNETSFTLTGLESAYANTFDKVTKSGKDTLKIAKDADFGSVGLNVQFTFTMPAANGPSWAVM